ncbi:MAG: hypothetical protein R3249_01010 [Nitriliruptorales bacterium]|nr:hypothetical protein [Nitriliruptorales bacterium]
MLNRIGSAVLAGALSLSLIAADGANATPAVGTSATSLTAVSLGVSGADLGSLADTLGLQIPDIDLDLVDAGTYASNDAARSLTGSPLAIATLTPLRLNDTEVGSVEASSDGAATDNSQGLAVPAPLGGSLGTADASAAASADDAIAMLDATLTQVTALLDSVGITVEPGLIASGVNSTSGASAQQAIATLTAGIDLGALLPQDILEMLPLANLLALIDALGLPVSGDLQAVLDGVTTALDEVVSQLATVEAGSSILAGHPIVDDIVAIEGVLPDVEALDAVRDDLVAAQSLDPVDLAAALPGLVTDVTNLIACDTGVLAGTELLDALLVCVDDALVAAASPFTGATTGATALDDLNAMLDSLVAAVTAAVASLVAAIEDLSGGLVDLGAVLALLDADLLDELAGLLGGLSAADLVSLVVSGLAVSATADADSAAASASCDLVDLDILGTNVPINCDDIDATIDAITGTVTGVIGQLGDVLGALTAGAVTVGNVEVDVLDRSITTGTDGDYNVASAVFNLLHVSLPSVTIDPSGLADGLLGQLGGLPVGLDAIEGTLGDLATELGAASGLAGPIGDLTTAVDGLGTGLGDLDSALGTVEGLLDGLPIFDLLGSLTDTIATPSIVLDVDPASSAEFMPAAAPTPELPSTGGGIALLGVLVLGGAWGLRRGMVR